MNNFEREKSDTLIQESDTPKYVCTHSKALFPKCVEGNVCINEFIATLLWNDMDFKITYMTLNKFEQVNRCKETQTLLHYQ